MCANTISMHSTPIKKQYRVLPLRRTTRDMDNSPPLKLPPGLRNRIYDLALRRGEPILLRWCRRQKRLVHNSMRLRTFRHLRALPNTCKQTRSESLQLFYAINTFEIALYSCKSNEVCRVVDTFSKAIGRSNIPALTKVVLDVGSFSAWTHSPVQEAIRRLRPMVLATPRLSLTIRGECRLMIHWTDHRGVIVELDIRDLASSCDVAIVKLDDVYRLLTRRLALRRASAVMSALREIRALQQWAEMA